MHIYHIILFQNLLQQPEELCGTVRQSRRRNRTMSRIPDGPENRLHQSRHQNQRPARGLREPTRGTGLHSWNDVRESVCRSCRRVSIESLSISAFIFEGFYFLTDVGAFVHKKRSCSLARWFIFLPVWHRTIIIGSPCFETSDFVAEIS